MSQNLRPFAIMGKDACRQCQMWRIMHQRWPSHRQQCEHHSQHGWSMMEGQTMGVDSQKPWCIWVKCPSWTEIRGCMFSGHLWWQNQMVYEETYQNEWGWSNNGKGPAKAMQCELWSYQMAKWDLLLLKMMEWRFPQENDTAANTADLLCWIGRRHDVGCRVQPKNNHPVNMKEIMQCCWRVWHALNANCGWLDYLGNVKYRKVD